ncbi:MAG: DUF3887 domain-containing protein [Chloroflexi bacterium]|nr:DUF3887 domain-containing protein [Chloroflexota bacterium]
MQLRKTTLVLILLASLTLTALAACGPQATAAVSEAYVTTLAEEKMQALNDGDYATFTADFSDVLANAIPEDSFQDLRETILGASGRFESVTGLRLAQRQDARIRQLWYHLQIRGGGGTANPGICR